MKITLHQVPQGVIATSQEEIKDVRPYKGRYILEQGHIINILPTYLTDLSECKLIIASTFGWWKELVIEADTNIGYETIAIDDLVISIIDFTKTYDYTETDNQVIIKI